MLSRAAGVRPKRGLFPDRLRAVSKLDAIGLRVPVSCLLLLWPLNRKAFCVLFRSILWVSFTFLAPAPLVQPANRYVQVVCTNLWTVRVKELLKNFVRIHLVQTETGFEVV